MPSKSVWNPRGEVAALPWLSTPTSIEPGSGLRHASPRPQNLAQSGCGAAERSVELAHEQAQFELAKLGENGADPAVDLGRAAGPLGHIGAERKTRAVDDAAHDRRQARDADDAVFAAARREIRFFIHHRHRFIVHR